MNLKYKNKCKQTTYRCNMCLGNVGNMKTDSISSTIHECTWAEITDLIILISSAVLLKYIFKDISDTRVLPTPLKNMCICLVQWKGSSKKKYVHIYIYTSCISFIFQVYPLFSHPWLRKWLQELNHSSPHSQDERLIAAKKRWPSWNKRSVLGM